MIQVPTLVDLFCGKGGWTTPALARGWRCIGLDITDHGYPGEFIQRALPIAADEIAAMSPTLVTASPPCEDYARFHLPWIDSRVKPDETLLRWSIGLADQLQCPVIIECSKFAARHVRGSIKCGPYHLWGAVPALLPQVVKRKGDTPGRNPAARAQIAENLAEWIIHSFT